MTSPRPNRPGRRRRMAIGASWALTALAAAPPAWGQTVPQEPAAAMLAVLVAQDESAEARAEAAWRLLGMGRYAALTEAIEANPPAAAAVAAGVARIGARDRTDEHLRLVGGAVPLLAGEPLDGALRVLSEHRSRLAVRPVMTLLLSRPRDEVRALALRTLVAQTGLDTLGADIDAWRAWWSEVEWLTEPEWRARLAASHAARAARLDGDRAALVSRLSDVYRRLHAATPQEQRSALLAEMLADARVELRLAGLELAQQTVLNARALGDPATAALLDRLRDDDPRLRMLASTVIGRAAPAGAPGAVADALRGERDHEAAAALLALASRWPTQRAIEPALRWMTNSAAHRPAAADVLASAARAGLLDDPHWRNRALDALRVTGADEVSPAVVRLADAIGEQDDIGFIATLLTHGRAEVRHAAAGALARRPGHDASLAAALRADHDLLPIIAQGVALRAPTYQSLRWIRDAARAAGIGEQAIDAMDDQFVSFMPPAEAERAAMTIHDWRRRAEALERVASHEALRSHVMRERRADLLLLAAQTRVLNADAQGALATLDRLADGRRPESVRLRTMALLRQGGFEAAAELDAPASVWVESLELCVESGLEHALELEGVVLERFADSLTDAERRRVERAALRRAEVGGGPGPEGDADKPPSDA